MTAGIREFADAGDGVIGTEVAPAGLLLVVAAGTAYQVGVGDRSLQRGNGGFLIGAQSRYGRSRLPGRAEGVEVELSWPTAARLFGPGLAELADQAVGVADLPIPGARSLADQLAGTAPGARARVVRHRLRTAAAFAPASNPLALEALRRITAGASSVTALADGLGCSRGYLHRAVRATVGQPPSVMIRVARLHRVLSGAPASRTWAERASYAGYADHAHLCHEMRALAGRAPTAS